MVSLQLLAQGGDGVFQKALLVARGAAEFLELGVVRFEHVLHLLALGASGDNVLLYFVTRVGSGLLKGALLFLCMLSSWPRMAEIVSRNWEASSAASCWAFCTAWSFSKRRRSSAMRISAMVARKCRISCWPCNSLSS